MFSKLLGLGAVSIAVAVGITTSVLAQSGTPNAPPPDLTFRSGGYFELLLRTVVYLAAISLLIYIGLRWVYPRVFRWNFPAGKTLTVMDRLPMGGTRSICVLRVGERYYLVGVTDGQIQLMTELDGAEMAAYYASTRGGPRPAGVEASMSAHGGTAAPGIGGVPAIDPNAGTPPWKRFLSGSRHERNVKG